MRKPKGFTLIELLIVIAIIGLLATLALVSLTSAQKRSRDTKRVADMKSMQTAMELYYNEKVSYPTLSSGGNGVQVDTDGDGVGDLAVDTWAKLSTVMSPYITTLPVDPNHDDGDVYTYITNNGGVNSPQYYLKTTLEDDHAALDQDVDGSVGDSLTSTDWFSLTSAGTTQFAGGTAPVSTSCDDGTFFYCLSGTAAQ